MPATTRSANKQTKLEDVGAGSKASMKSSKSKATMTKPTAGQKRKAEQGTDVDALDAKKAKQSSKSGDRDEQSDDVVVINRAPVLELWAACVAQILHPSLSWQSSLSVGGAISTITAISKGRSIGTMKKPDPGEAQEKKEKRSNKAEKEELDEVEVMSFRLNLDKDGQAMVGGKPKKGGEETLMKKYGGSEQYEKVKRAFQNSLKRWKGKEEELSERAFGFYEDFRPTIPPGQKGWGRKGQLRIETIKTAVAGG